MATEEIEISQLELADEILADMVTPVETATETKAVTLSQLRKWLGSSLPTGFILPAVGRIEDSRFTLLDGKTLSRTGTYEDFCNKVIEQVNAGNWFSCTQAEYDEDLSKYDQCGRFVIETDYVRIPTITRYIGATITLSEIGKTYKESLPNITGSFGGEAGVVMTGFQGQVGAINSVQNGTNNLWGSNQANVGYVEFDASKSSSTYQDGAKVNPENTKYPYYMVISTTGQTAEVGIDINKVHEDVNLKANKDLSDVTQTGKENIFKAVIVESYVNGSNWYRKYSDGWVEQGGQKGSIGNNSDVTVTFLKTMKDKSYSIVIGQKMGVDVAYRNQGIIVSGSMSTTGFNLSNRRFSSDASSTIDIIWEVRGKGA